jgi:hypothetical protein
MLQRFPMGSFAHEVKNELNRLSKKLSLTPSPQRRPEPEPGPDINTHNPYG